MNKQKRIRQEKGITLIALIITIVVLLILAVVAIRAVQGDGIIQYARNARNDYEQAQANEQAMLDNYISQIEGSLDEGTGSSSQITWTKTSEGDLAVGSTVVTSTNEEFYVIGFAGTNNETVELLAKNNLKADGSAQDPTGATNRCAFSSTNYWSSETSYPANLNDTEKYPIPEGETSIITIAKTYGASLGVTGRLMTVEEVYALGGSGEDGSTSGCPDFINSTNYWTGSAMSSVFVSGMYGEFRVLSDFNFDFNSDEGMSLGVRPVIEVLKSNIS